MTNRNAPYQHADGSNCWTKNCSLGNTLTNRSLEDFRKELDAKLDKLESKNAPVPLSAIASLDLFENEIKLGYIRRQSHPTLPLDIYNYSEITQFERRWNPATIAARGLIVDRETGMIVSRPLSKFFNYGERDIDVSDLQGEITVSEKLDGSCGISYPTPEGLQIATRGAFTSEQALHASTLLNERYAGKWDPKPGKTYMWEIIYPENRIVVDYGAEDDIVLLSAVDNKTGKTTPASEVTEWKWKKVEEFQFKSMEEVANSAERRNHEGFVVHYRDSDTRIKYKHKEYVEHHKIISNVSAKSIWKMLSEKKDLKSWTVNLPDEFTSYVVDTQTKLETQFSARKTDLINRHSEAVKGLPKDVSRKNLVETLRGKLGNEFHSALLVHDGKLDQLDKFIWADIEPSFEKAQIF